MCVLLQDLVQSCLRGEGGILEDMCYDRVGGPGTPPFGARGRSSVRYGTRLGDLKNKHSTHTHDEPRPVWTSLPITH